MAPPLTPRPDCPLEPTTTAETTSTQLFRVLYITLTGLVDSVVPNSRPWSLLGCSVSYIIKLAPIIWWTLPAGLAAPHPKPPNASTYNWLPDIMIIFYKHGNLDPNMLLTLGATCMFFFVIITYYTHKALTSLILPWMKNQPAKELKDPAPGAEPQNPATSQVQNVIVNQITTKVDMPQMGKLTLEEARRAMPVLHFHFQINANAYPSDTEKVLRVATMLSGDTPDWFRKATAEDVEFCLDYSKFETELMSTGNDQDIRYYALNSMLEIQQANCPIQAYINTFLKLKMHTQLEDELSAIIFRKGVNSAMKDLLKHHPPTLSLEELLPLCKGLSLNQEGQNMNPTQAGRAMTPNQPGMSPDKLQCHY
ncbi:hypothetical protein DSO57_1029488 [Entomophthora muscae]|uniref:Uncharacterized protein n=1 Tax=Entomophthora muscae TaxID=34485 RepID=A0ACC2TCE2_9FUNG|nr:hypothetical protein DSO57_1029488 [Entomophthora muscae]